MEHPYESETRYYDDPHGDMVQEVLEAILEAIDQQIVEAYSAAFMLRPYCSIVVISALSTRSRIVVDRDRYLVELCAKLSSLGHTAK